MGSISRFLTADQFPGLVAVPIAHNLYVYCNDDPINNKDPTGQLAIGSIIKKAGQTIKKAVKKVKQVVKKAVTTVKKVVKQTAKKAATTVKKAVKQVKKTVTTTVKTAVKTVNKAAAKTYQQAKTTVTDKVSPNIPRAPPEKTLDTVQTVLDLAGLVPGIGEIADGTNALIYTLRGDKTNAALSAAACIPFIGWGAFGMKAVNKGAKALDKVGDAYDVVRGAGKAIISNPLPQNGRFATVMPGKYAEQVLKGQGSLAGGPQAWIAATDDLKGINTVEEAANRLTLLDKNGALRLNGNAVVEFNLKSYDGLASPFNRTNPGFINGGRTGGGAREWLIPSDAQLENVTVRYLER